MSSKSKWLPLIILRAMGTCPLIANLHDPLCPFCSDPLLMRYYPSDYGTHDFYLMWAAILVMLCPTQAGGRSEITLKQWDVLLILRTKILNKFLTIGQLRLKLEQTRMVSCTFILLCVPYSSQWYKRYPILSRWKSCQCLIDMGAECASAFLWV